MLPRLSLEGQGPGLGVNPLTPPMGEDAWERAPSSVYFPGEQPALAYLGLPKKGARASRQRQTELAISCPSHLEHSLPLVPSGCSSGYIQSPWKDWSKAGESIVGLVEEMRQ